MAIAGNTVRLKAEFKTFDEVYADPTNIKLKIYDKNRKIIGNIVLDNNNKVSTGIYQYDYTIPNNCTEITYEFSGVLENKLITGRSVIDVDWV